MPGKARKTLYHSPIRGVSLDAKTHLNPCS